MLLLQKVLSRCGFDNFYIDPNTAIEGTIVEEIAVREMAALVIEKYLKPCHSIKSQPLVKPLFESNKSFYSCK